MAQSSFADRLWYVRGLRGISGADLMELATNKKGSGALISTIERTDLKSTKHNDALAHALGVTPTWLRTGDGKAPAGFNPDVARKNRIADVKRKRRKGKGTPPSPATKQSIETPRWAEPAVESKEDQISRMQQQLTTDLVALVRIAGREHTETFLASLTPYLANFGVEKVTRENNIRAVD